MHFRHDDLLGLRHLSRDEILFIIDQATSLKEVLTRPNKQLTTLRGKTLVNLFFEPSTRTRISFELAIKLMGAGAVNVNIAVSAIKKGESLFDTLKNIDAMKVDGIIVRHQYGGVPKFIADILDIPVINAGDGFGEHPTQGLLDIYTMMENRGDLAGKKVMVLGDIMHSRVARSNIWGLNKLGAKVYVCGPTTLIPREAEEMGVEVVTHMDDLLPELDFVNVLRVQFERQQIGYFPSVREYRKLFGLTANRAEKLKASCLVMHPGPMNRGIEIDSEVADGPLNVILDQVTNGLAVRMAVLYVLMTKGTEVEKPV